MVNTLTFTSNFGDYALDNWPEDDPRYGESTQHMLASGDWTYGAQPTNRDGVINYNDPVIGKVASILGVNNDQGTGGPVPTANAWDFTMELTIAEWPTPGNNSLYFLVVQGRPNPPYSPGTTNFINLGFNRAGFMFTGGQIAEHTHSTGVTFHGGTVGVHVEVTPKGPWYLQAFVGGQLAATFCGNAWGGGELYAASWGCMSVTGAAPLTVLTSPSCSGTMGHRDGAVTCPPDPVAGRGRTHVLWWP